MKIRTVVSFTCLHVFAFLFVILAGFDAALYEALGGIVQESSSAAQAAGTNFEFFVFSLLGFPLFTVGKAADILFLPDAYRVFLLGLNSLVWGVGLTLLWNKFRSSEKPA